MALVLTALVAAPGTARALELTFWTTEFEPDRLATVRYLTNAYAAERANLKINVVGVEENDFLARFDAALQSGHPPDLVDAGGIVLKTLADAGHLDFGAATAMIREIGASRFYDGALKAMRAGDPDQYLAVPLRQWAQGLWYRADWFKEAKLPPPTTWERMLSAARIFNAPEAGRYGIIIGTQADIYAEQIFSQLAMSNGARLFDKSGKFAPDQKKFSETFAFYKHLTVNAPPGDVTWRQRDLFLNSHAAMMFYSTFIADDIALYDETNSPEDYQTAAAWPPPRFGPAKELINVVRMVPVIKHTRSATYTEVNALGVTAGRSRQTRDAVLGLIRFLFRDDAYISWLHMAPGGMLPTIREIVSKPAFTRDLQGIFRHYGRARILGFMKGPNDAEPFGIFAGGDARNIETLAHTKILPNLIKSVVGGKMTPDEAAQRLSKARVFAAK